MAFYNLALNHFSEKERLKFILKQGELLIESLGIEVGHAKFIIFLFLQDELFCKVLKPRPNNSSLTVRSNFKSLSNFIDSFGISAIIKISPPLPYLIEVANMHEAILSSVEVNSFCDSFIVIEPIGNSLDIKSYLTLIDLATPVHIFLIGK